MRVIARSGEERVAVVYLAEMRDGRHVEFAESIQPPIPREDKWVLLISTMFGCPIRCLMCDAGGHYRGRMTKDEILGQIDYLIGRRFPDGLLPAGQIKIQFARMGEPALNPAVLDALEELPGRYRARGLMPSISTMAPAGADAFFERLLSIKNALYSRGRFQLQFSIHTTDEPLRDGLIPARKWTLGQIGRYGERFHSDGDRRITLNFALPARFPIDPAVMFRHFDPERFLVKITPLNPTYRARENRMETHVRTGGEPFDRGVIDSLREAGYEVIVSIGEEMESQIGSNCGQLVRRHLAAAEPIPDGYGMCALRTEGNAPPAGNSMRRGIEFSC